MAIPGYPLATDSLCRTPAAGQVAHPQAEAIRRAESQNAAARSCAVSASCVAPVPPEPETKKAALADGLGVAPQVVLRVVRSRFSRAKADSQPGNLTTF